MTEIMIQHNNKYGISNKICVFLDWIVYKAQTFHFLTFLIHLFPIFYLGMALNVFEMIFSVLNNDLLRFVFLIHSKNIHNIHDGHISNYVWYNDI